MASPCSPSPHPQNNYTTTAPLLPAVSLASLQSPTLLPGQGHQGQSPHLLEVPRCTAKHRNMWEGHFSRPGPQPRPPPRAPRRTAIPRPRPATWGGPGPHSRPQPLLSLAVFLADIQILCATAVVWGFALHRRCTHSVREVLQTNHLPLPFVHGPRGAHPFLGV